jgi:hypothetical protein
MHISFVLTSTPPILDASAIARVYDALHEGLPEHAGDGDTATIADSILAAMPGAIPTGEAEQAAAYSVCAYGRGFALAPHCGYVVVTTPKLEDPRHSLIEHTLVVAATAKALGALGVYEGDSSATHPTDFYVDVSTCGRLPVMLWTGISIAAEPGDRIGILTRGIQNQVGLPDLLLTAPRAMGNDALAFLFDLLVEMVTQGEPVGAHQTVGRTEEEKLPVRYVPSPIDGSRQVVRIEMR